MNIKFLTINFFVALLLFVSPLLSNAQGKQIFNLTSESVQNSAAAQLNEAGWKYHSGDDANWANPNFDDASWETLKDSALMKDSLPQSGWNGVGWFRLRLNVALDFSGVPLNLEMVHLGASKIYLDGKLIKQFGRIGNSAATEQPYNPNAEPLSITFEPAAEHLLAVRYSNQTAADVDSGYGARNRNDYRAARAESDLRHRRKDSTILPIRVGIWDLVLPTLRCRRRFPSRSLFCICFCSCFILDSAEIFTTAFF